MTNRGGLLAIIAVWITGGCGRLGFDRDASGGDDAGAGSRCVARAIPLTSSPVTRESPRLGWNSDKLAVTWTEDPLGTPAAYFRTVSLSGDADPVIALGGTSSGSKVDIAWDGKSWQLAWSGPDNTSARVLRSINGAAGQVTSSVSAQEVRVAALDSGATAYMWWNMPSATPTGGQLQLSVLDANGNKLVNEQTIVIDASGLAEELVWTGSELVVFYSTSEGMMTMQRMTSSSSAIGIPTLLFPVPPDGILTQGPSVDWIGDRFVIGWFGFRASRVAYVAADGTLLSPILTTPVPVPDASQVDITDSWTAAGATSDLVVFNSAGVSYAVSLARDGTFGTPVVLPDLRSPTAIWAGTQWIVAARQHAVGQPANTSDIYLFQVCP